MTIQIDGDSKESQDRNHERDDAGDDREPQEMPRIRVLVVDEYPAALAGLRRVLEPDRGIEVVDEATDDEEIISAGASGWVGMAGDRDRIIEAVHDVHADFRPGIETLV